MRKSSGIKVVATVASIVRASSRPDGPGVVERAQSVPRLARAVLDGSYVGSSVGRLALVAAAVAYVASPIDLLPEAVLPVLGVADDIVMLTWAVRAFMEETERFLAWERGQGGRAGASGRAGGPREAVTDAMLESLRKKLER